MSPNTARTQPVQSQLGRRGGARGAVRGLLELAGLDFAKATAAHFAEVWGSAQALLPSLGVAPPPWRTEPQEIAIDALHHAVYAAATGAAYAILEKSS